MTFLKGTVGLYQAIDGSRVLELQPLDGLFFVLILSIKTLKPNLIQMFWKKKTLCIETNYA